MRRFGSLFRGLLLLAHVASGRAIAGDAPRLFVLSQDANELAVIDTATDTVVKTLKLEAGPASLALSSDGRRAYVTHPEAQKISVVDLTRLAVLEVLPHPGTPFGIATDTRGRLYIGDWNRDVLSYVDGTLHDRAGEVV